ncbi:hypothetical protein JG687_00014047 [Phytophthora cactorum]|uniref:Concanavalin A-like lectin/glucanase domain n=1 Tax=Phytophthora cactorum TaxID=29920 RepID=A0A8T1U0W4_9STRA|nr:hypothetical protein JG687_00014047 [Phytophthora cactorum]
MELHASAAVTICSFLTGLDALSLSHSSSFWLQHLNGSPYWQSKLPSLADPLHTAAYKALYLRSRSLGFKGLIKSYSPGIRYSDSYQVPKVQLSSLRSTNFSFDVWFALLPEQPDGASSDGNTFGGIIYGLQSSSRENRSWPYYHQQFVVVSSTGDLYCSVLDSRSVVARDMIPNRWYHLALTYDNDTQAQDVYLDGVMIHSSTGALHNEWGFLTHEQIGTGCITAGSLNFPHPNYLGWYGFRGVIDDFRIWNGALLQDDVAFLACGRKLANQRLRASVKAAITHENLTRSLTWVNVQLTMCTRPTEGRNMQLVPFRSPAQPNCTIS